MAATKLLNGLVRTPRKLQGEVYAPALILTTAACVQADAWVVYVCICMYMHVGICVYVYVCMYVCMCVCVCMYVCTYVCIHVCVCVCVI
jgi:hypothetical protein